MSPGHRPIARAEGDHGDFRPGDRVMTVDGIPGEVIAVEEGPAGGAESYEVVLDDEMGGGAYGASDLTLIERRSAALVEADSQQVAMRSDDDGNLLSVASEDYPELGTVLHDRLPPAMVVHAAHHLASEWLVADADGNIKAGPFTTTDEAREVMEPGDVLHSRADQDAYDNWATGDDIGSTDYPMATIGSVPVEIRTEGLAHEFRPTDTWSFDWCRYRRRSRCFYPKDLDHEASVKEGYAVWIPVDRGPCPRGTWDAQKECPISEPGPNSGEPGALLDATIPYDEGGQRGGVPVEAALDIDSFSDTYDLDSPEIVQSIVAQASADPEFGWHVTAAWSDVQAKAKRIKDEGGVRILANTDHRVVAEVKGDSNIYQTSIMRVPGSKATAMWECGCAWATYSWGRSGRWKRYEGRLCSHALALNYVMSAQEWGGGEVTPEPNAPAWSKGVKPVLPGPPPYPPSPWSIGPPRRVSSALQVTAMPPIAADPSIEEIVDWYLNVARQDEPFVSMTIKELADRNLGEVEGFQFRFKGPGSLERKVRDRMSRGGDPRLWVKDALRYTIVLHPAVYAAQVQDILYGLQERRFKIVEEENTWPRGDSYSGLHYTLETPTGILIELQFHTGESFSLKQQTLHALYEEFRAQSTPLPRKQELYDLMATYWEPVEIPEGALEYPVVKRYPRPASLDPRLRQSLASAIKEAWSSQGAMCRYRGLVVPIEALLPGGEVRLPGGTVVPASAIVYPTYDPRAGLDYIDILGALVQVDEEDLYTALGELALPPYSDGDGGHLAGSETIDCAPIAQQIVDRMEAITTPVEGVLHDEPEPALPQTVGGDDEDYDNPIVGGEQPSLEDLKSRLSHLTGGSSGDSDIAAAANRFLESGSVDPKPGIRTQALRAFTPAEQRMLIEEGEREGVRAANLDRLDITGTHYEALEAAASDDDDWI